MSSIIFLLSLFYFRFIPLSIFWTVFPLLVKSLKVKKLYFNILAAVLIVLSYTVAITVVTALPIAILNYFFQDGDKGILTPVLLFVSKELEFPGLMPFKNYFYSFLLNGIFCTKKKLVVLRSLATFLEIISLVSIILGGIEVYNDYHSHLNPDAFDFFFPENGAGMFWGGIAALTLSYFFLTFLIPGQSIRKWKRRLEISSKISPSIEEFIIARSLFHPNFFLSPSGRTAVKENHKLADKLPLLLEKAFIKNKDRIPDEWLI